MGGMADIVGPSVLPLIVQLACFCGKKKKDTAQEDAVRTEAGVRHSAVPAESNTVLGYSCCGNFS